MYFSNNICFLCLTYNKNVTSKYNFDLHKELEYFIPKDIFQKTEIPDHVCEECSENLYNNNQFKRRCLKNIVIYNEYVNKLSQTQDSTENNSEISDETVPLNCNAEVKCEILEIVDKKIQIEKLCDDIKIEKESTESEDKKNYFTELNTIKDDLSLSESELEENELNKDVKYEEYDKNVELFFDNQIFGDCSTNINESKQNISTSVETIDAQQNGETEFEQDNLLNEVSSGENLINQNKPELKSKEKFFKCEECEKVIKTKSDLRKHILIHRGERPFKCDQCSKAFVRKTNLNKHKFIHKGDRPFKCNECQTTFIRKGDLTRHSLIHETDRPYSCETCEKKFTRIDHLNKHQATHIKTRNGSSREKIFECDVCQKKYTSRTYLKIHKSTHEKS